MRPPDQDRAAYSRDCITLAKIRRRIESCPFLTAAERASTSEQLRVVIELLDRRSARDLAKNPDAVGANGRRSSMISKDMARAFGANGDGNGKKTKTKTKNPGAAEASEER